MELHLEKLPRTVELDRDEQGAVFRYIDQRALPYNVVHAETGDWKEAVCAVKELAVRGAPALGLAGASALALWASHEGMDQDQQAYLNVAEEIGQARPTAVNLKWGVDKALAATSGMSGTARADALFQLVKQMEAQDEACNRAMGRNGAALLQPGSRILTHCNAGSLATGYYGTALGVVYAAAEQGKIARVYADETRPVGQGARLTVWELAQVGIPVTLICDNMAASLMAKGVIDAVIVGADRIARNGDVANKIGTYGVAILAHEHGIPFYVAAPTSSIDPTLADGSGIVIEQRAATEVLPQPISGVEVYNPAFDVTPARYMTRIITEEGVFAPNELFA